jgi:hypothetical protein
MAYQNDGLSRRGLISSMSAGAFGAAGLSMLNQGLPSLSAESTIPSGSAERVIYIYLSEGKFFQRIISYLIPVSLSPNGRS